MVGIGLSHRENYAIYANRFPPAIYTPFSYGSLVKHRISFKPDVVLSAPFKTYKALPYPKAATLFQGLFSIPCCHFWH